MLVGDVEMSDQWSAVATHTDAWGDPLGDNKVEYRHESGKSIVLKLKTAPDPASGILDQYEFGPLQPDDHGGTKPLAGRD